MATEMNVLHGLLHDRITSLLAARRLFRKVYGAEWPPRRHAVDVELRALLRLAREARRVAQAEPITPAEVSSYHDYQAAR